MLGRFLFTIILVTIGNENFQTSQKFLDAGGPTQNEGIAVKLLPYLRLAMILFTVGRVILLGLSLKYKKVTKSFIYYELVLDIIQALLPQDVVPSYSLTIVVITGVLDFMFNYFDFLPSLVKVYIALIVHFIGQALYVKDQDRALTCISYLLMMLWSGVVLFGLHLIFTMVGMTYVDAEVLKNGNEQLLNTLSEGVIIFQGDEKDVIFTNTAAKSL